MELPQDLFIALALLIGVIGSIIQIYPGALIIAGAIGVWAALEGGSAWAVFAIAVLALVLAGIVKYLWAGKYLKRDGVPNMTIVLALIVGFIGFFILPVIGLPIGFILTVYVVELMRGNKHEQAWAMTITALKATGITIIVELAGSLLACGIWVIGLIIT
ncbi:DUF456 domain-containing protein [Jonesia quinghaiensis]|uniref:DUF456 domain-containing protein n=1 Tax=Jonesia quinghaiensis TaxID=262806 RepID=UPI000405C8BD|nr:DUF456 domain-containing protein [Jonesia quinghaiensis]